MNLENLRPINDGVLVRVDPQYRPSSSLIVPTDPSRMNCAHDAWGSSLKARWGKVIRIGPGRVSKKTGTRKPIHVVPGDMVSFSGLTKAEDGDFVLITERDVLVVENGH